MDRKPGRWLALSAAALPALLPLWLILRYGVDVPYWDQWDMAKLYVKAADGTLSFWDFTATHNEHRMFVPRSLTFLINLLTGWNTIVEMLLSWLIACITSLCVLWLTRQTAGEGNIDGRVLVLWFLSNLMLFTLTQQENWLWGIGVMNVLPPMFLLAAMAVLYTGWSRPVRIGVSMVMCAGAMFSSGHGIIAFPLVGIMVAWSNSWKQLKAKQMALLAWAGGFALCALMFIYGYKLPRVAAGLEDKVVTLWDRIVYLMTFLGNQFLYVRSMEWQTSGIVAGSISLTLFLLAFSYFIYLAIRRTNERAVGRMLPWVLIGIYTLLSVSIAAVFRTNVGLENAISSRYVTVTLYLQVAMIHLFPMICQDLRARFPIVRAGGSAISMEPVWTNTPVVLGTALVMAWLVVLPSSLYAGQLSSLSRRQAKSALLFINVLPDNRVLERHVFPRIEELKALANRLDQLGYLRPRLITSDVADDLVDPRFDSKDLARLGEFERLVETGPKQITAAGWALDPGRTRAADMILLSVMNANRQQKLFVLSNGVILRPDLVRRFEDPLYEMAGWSIVYGTSLTPEQVDAVEFSAWALDCDTGKLRALPGKPRVTRPHLPTTRP